MQIVKLIQVYFINYVSGYDVYVCVQVEVHVLLVDPHAISSPH